MASEERPSMCVILPVGDQHDLSRLSKKKISKPVAEQPGDNNFDPYSEQTSSPLLSSYSSDQGKVASAASTLSKTRLYLSTKPHFSGGRYPQQVLPLERSDFSSGQAFLTVREISLLDTESPLVFSQAKRTKSEPHNSHQPSQNFPRRPSTYPGSRHFKTQPEDFHFSPRRHVPDPFDESIPPSPGINIDLVWEDVRKGRAMPLTTPIQVQTYCLIEQVQQPIPASTAPSEYSRILFMTQCLKSLQRENDSIYNEKLIELIENAFESLSQQLSMDILVPNSHILLRCSVYDWQMLVNRAFFQLNLVDETSPRSHFIRRIGKFINVPPLQVLNKACYDSKPAYDALNSCDPPDFSYWLITTILPSEIRLVAQNSFFCCEEWFQPYLSVFFTYNQCGDLDMWKRACWWGLHMLHERVNLWCRARAFKLVGGKRLDDFGTKTSRDSRATSTILPGRPRNAIIGAPSGKPGNKTTITDEVTPRNTNPSDVGNVEHLFHYCLLIGNGNYLICRFSPKLKKMHGSSIQWQGMALQIIQPATNLSSEGAWKHFSAHLNQIHLSGATSYAANVVDDTIASMPRPRYPHLRKAVAATENETMENTMNQMPEMIEATAQHWSS